MSDFSYTYSLPYIITFLLLLLCIFPFTNKKITYNNFSRFNYYNNDFLRDFFLFIIMILFIGCRGYVFTDWKAYNQMFDTLPRMQEGISAVAEYFNNNVYGQMWEPGFILYSIISKTLYNNYFFLQFISFFIDFLILKYFFESELKDKYYIGFLCFFIFSGLYLEINLLRNSKAIMLFLISIKFIHNKQILPYMLLNLFGALFHTTSLLFLPLFFISVRKNNKVLLLLFFLICNIIYIFNISWIKTILLLISNISDIRLFSLIKPYLESTHFSSSYGFSISYFEKIITFILVFTFENKIIAVNKKFTFYIKCLYIYIFLFLSCSEMKILIDRILVLFIFSYWIFFPLLYSVLSKSKKYFFLFLFISYSLLKLSTYNSILFNYNHIFSDKYTPDEYKSYIEKYNKKYVY